MILQFPCNPKHRDYDRMMNIIYVLYIHLYDYRRGELAIKIRTMYNGFTIKGFLVSIGQGGLRFGNYFDRIGERKKIKKLTASKRSTEICLAEKFIFILLIV